MAARTYKLILEYDGTKYHGWQIQPDRRTVQSELENAMRTIFAVPIRIVAAGRTDTGVHALGQVVSFTAETGMTTDRLKRALNGVLPHDASVVDIREVQDGFNARFDARSRSYRYSIATRRISVGRRYAWQVKYALDRDLLVEATRPLKGELNLRGFSKGNDDEDYRTIVFKRSWTFDENMIYFDINAVRFFHHTVRSIVGTAVESARGGESADLVKRILETKDRSLAGPTAPACGLCLVHVDYGDDE